MSTSNLYTAAKTGTTGKVVVCPACGSARITGKPCPTCKARNEAGRLQLMADAIQDARTRFTIFDLYRDSEGAFIATPPAQPGRAPNGQGIARHIKRNSGHWDVIEPIPSTDFTQRGTQGKTRKAQH